MGSKKNDNFNFCSSKSYAVNDPFIILWKMEEFEVRLAMLMLFIAYHISSNLSFLNINLLDLDINYNLLFIFANTDAVTSLAVTTWSFSLFTEYFKDVTRTHASMSPLPTHYKSNVTFVWHANLRLGSFFLPVKCCLDKRC